MRSPNSTYLILLLCLIGACGFRSEKETTSIIQFSNELVGIMKAELEAVPGKGQVFHSGLPFTGISLKHYADGQLEESITYKDGKKEGVYTKWYLDGTMSYESHYEANKIHGMVRSWWSNGMLRSESTLVHGVMQGTHRQWYASGALFKEMQLKDGREEGMQRAWRENGKIYNNYEAKNGRIFGLKKTELCYELESEVIPNSN